MGAKTWTKQEEVLLQELYSRADLFVSAIAIRLSRTASQVYNKARAMGLKRPPETRALGGAIGAQTEAARQHRFPKGHTPPNKGKKMPPEVYAKCRPTMFQKGHVSINTRPLGSERVNTDGYIEIKIAEPNKWACKHRLIWEQAHGSIPKGYNIQFKDKNRQNCTLDNLYIISRADQLQNENSLIVRYPTELQRIIRLRGSLKRQITLHYKKKQRVLGDE